jgi:hypothetical protein
MSIKSLFKKSNKQINNTASNFDAPFYTLSENLVFGAVIVILGVLPGLFIGHQMSEIANKQLDEIHRQEKNKINADSLGDRNECCPKVPCKCFPQEEERIYPCPR